MACSSPGTPLCRSFDSVMQIGVDVPTLGAPFLASASFLAHPWFHGRPRSNKQSQGLLLRLNIGLLALQLASCNGFPSCSMIYPFPAPNQQLFIVTTKVPSI